MGPRTPAALAVLLASTLACIGAGYDGPGFRGMITRHLGEHGISVELTRCRQVHGTRRGACEAVLDRDQIEAIRAALPLVPADPDELGQHCENAADPTHGCEAVVGEGWSGLRQERLFWLWTHPDGRACLEYQVPWG